MTRETAFCVENVSVDTRHTGMSLWQITGAIPEGVGYVQTTPFFNPTKKNLKQLLVQPCV